MILGDMRLQTRTQSNGASIIEARQPEAAEIIPSPVSLYHVGNDAPDSWPDTEPVTTHAGCDEKTADRLHAIDDGDDIGHGVDHASPARL